jgi:hypothetical protein
MADVRSKIGAPIADDFNSSSGTPIVCNQTTGGISVLKADSTIQEMALVAGSTTQTFSVANLQFPATQVPSSDPNNFDDYDEYTSASTACSGALTTAVVWRIVKAGKVVTLEIPAVAGTTTNVGNINYGLTIPAKYRPPAIVSQSIGVIINAIGSSTAGLAIVTTAGVIVLYRDTVQTGWGTAANTGSIYTTTMTWII